ncbi:MAG: HD domain-containing protein [Flavobacteriales bacterium]|nr:HD domain-containing protein [Flavobacteriales bacterium]
MNNTPPKYKIINDPVYGFISIPDRFIQELIDHPYFQRLRRIKQMGLAHYVYPGAHHTRFHHALGAMYLMDEALKVLKDKGVSITDDERLGALAAVLLHDVGHGPFSHALESTLVKGVSHEALSLAFMQELNEEFDGKLHTAIQIFKGEYPKTFLCNLVSGQLDVDRLDYLRRDSFYTGVSEGVVGAERIIKLISVVDNQLVVEEKGIYSVEKFLIARRLMYWQVYLHKTVISTEFLILNILRRVKELTLKGRTLFSGRALAYFLHRREPITTPREIVTMFSMLDDADVAASLKEWSQDEDPILSDLCQRILNRRLFKIELSNLPFSDEYLAQMRQKVEAMGTGDDFLSYHFTHNEVENTIYSTKNSPIRILLKNGEVKDITEVSETIRLLKQVENQKKYFILYPRELG